MHTPKYLRIMVFLLVLIASSGLISFSEIGESISEDQRQIQHEYPYRIYNKLSDYPAMNGFDRVIDQFMQKWNIKGATVALMDEGKLIYSKGYGYANVEEKIEVQPSHLFRIASVSKLITGIAIMKMVEDSIIHLDDQVFGEEGLLNDSLFLNIRDKRVKDVTIAHLLHHSGGWTRGAGDPMFIPRHVANYMGIYHQAPDLDMIIRYVLKYRHLGFEPGSKSYYSNFGYAILGKVIEKMTCLPYEQYVRQSVLLPLDIYDMRLGRNFINGKYPDEVNYYTNNNYEVYSFDGSGKHVPRQYGGNDIETLGAAGGWISSAPSLLKLIAAVDGDTNSQDILKPETIDYMVKSTDKLDPVGWKGTDSTHWWRTGSFAGTSAMLKKMPDGKVWVMITNTSNYKGPHFTSYINYYMKNAMNKIADWPSYNLFNYHCPPYIASQRISRIIMGNELSLASSFSPPSSFSSEKPLNQ